MDCLEVTSVAAKWATALFALLAGATGIVVIKSNNRSAKWASATFAFLAAATSLVAILADSAIEDWRKQIRSTLPIVDVELKQLEDLRFYVLVESKNLIPFEFTWVAVTQRDIIISPIMMGWETVYPTKDRHVFAYETTLQLERVIEDYVELRFQYRSAYSAEQNYPDALKEEKILKYKLANGRLEALPVQSGLETIS